MKFRVYAECVTDCYVDIDAESEEEALDRARDMESCEFETDDDYGSGDWRVTYATLLDE